MIKLYDVAINQAETSKKRLQQAGGFFMILTLILLLFGEITYSIVSVLLTTMAFVSSFAMENRLQALQNERMEEMIKDIAEK